MTTNVYAAIAAVQAEIAATGIGKHRHNKQQGYQFRGIDDVFNALAPILAKHRLVIVPRIVARECVERQGKSGGALFYTTVEAEFDFVSAEDGSKHTARTYGEAMDSGDKSTNKAMSMAYKYAAFLTFAIPTEGTPDADEQTHEVRYAPNDEEARQVRECKSLEDLRDLWQSLSPQQRKTLAGVKEARKAELESEAA